MLVVAALAARAGSTPAAMITATRRWTGSAANNGQSVSLVFRPAIFDRHVLALDITGLLQALAKAPQAPRLPVRRLGIEVADNWHRRLLCARRERPRGHR